MDYPITASLRSQARALLDNSGSPRFTIDEAGCWVEYYIEFISKCLFHVLLCSNINLTLFRDKVEVGLLIINSRFLWILISKIVTTLSQHPSWIMWNQLIILWDWSLNHLNLYHNKQYNDINVLHFVVSLLSNRVSILFP